MLERVGMIDCRMICEECARLRQIYNAVQDDFSRAPLADFPYQLGCDLEAKVGLAGHIEMARLAVDRAAFELKLHQATHEQTSN